MDFFSSLIWNELIFIIHFLESSFPKPHGGLAICEQFEYCYWLCPLLNYLPKLPHLFLKIPLVLILQGFFFCFKIMIRLDSVFYIFSSFFRIISVYAWVHQNDFQYIQDQCSQYLKIITDSYEDNY